jgi:anionic cell wall polymer biosynthesis LytR-Cps2A-Psr (LCP) family protein
VIRTVEQLTRVRISHFAIIDWDGFSDLTNALGGITVDVPVSSYDPMNKVSWKAGIHHLDGKQALLYVRDRYGLANGDFGRELRQQNFLRAVFEKLRSTGALTDPLRAGTVLHALTEAVSVDSTLSDREMMSLAFSLRSLKPGQMVFATAPYLGTGQVGSQSVVRLNLPLDRGFWHAFEYDSLPAFMRARGLHRLGESTP